MAAERTAALERLWDEILDGVDAELGDRLNGLLEVEAGSRFSVLERLRTAPARVTGLELERTLRRLADVRRLGTSRVDVSAVPSNRLLALARYGFSAKAPSLRDLAEPRRTATLVATLRHLEQKATDDALDLLEVLMQTKLLARVNGSRQRSGSERSRASRWPPQNWRPPSRSCWTPRRPADDISVAEVWAEIERVVPRGQVAASLAAVLKLAPSPDEEADEAWRAELVKRHQTIRPFLPVLTEVIEFGAVEGGHLVVDAVRRLPELLGPQVRSGARRSRPAW